MGKLVNIFLERELCRMPSLEASYYTNSAPPPRDTSDADAEDDEGVSAGGQAKLTGEDGLWSYGHYEGIREEKARGKEQKTWKFEGWTEDGLQMPRVRLIPSRPSTPKQITDMPDSFCSN